MFKKFGKSTFKKNNKKVTEYRTVSLCKDDLRNFFFFFNVKVITSDFSMEISFLDFVLRFEILASHKMEFVSCDPESLNY